MKTCKSFLIIGFLSLIALAACKSEDDYHEKMRLISKSIEDHPQRSEDWLRLIEYSKSNDLWERIYAYQFLVALAPNQIGSRRVELIAIFKRGLLDADYGVKKLAAQGTQAIGPEGVNSNFLELLSILKPKNEDDLTWLTAESLGETNDPDKAALAFDALMDAARKPNFNYPREAPQLKIIALKAALKLARNGLIEDTASYFSDQMTESDPMIRELIDEYKKELKNH